MDDKLIKKKHGIWALVSILRYSYFLSICIRSLKIQVCIVIERTVKIILKRQKNNLIKTEQKQRVLFPIS